jgi:hypothetical protein
MAEVPYVPVPQVQNSPASSAQVSVPNANAQAFGEGVGVAMQKVGATMEQTAHVMDQKALEFQGLQNEVSANNLLTQAQVEIGAERQKLSSMEGENAVNYLPEYNKNIQAIRDKYRGMSDNPAVAHAMELRLTRQVGESIIQGASHAGTQVKQALAQSRDARITMATADAATAEESVFKSSLDEVKNIAVEEANTKYGPESESNKSARELFIQQRLGQVWKNRLEMKAMTDPFKAKEMLNGIPNDQIDGNTKLNLAQTIERSAANAGSRNIANTTAPNLLRPGIPAQATGVGKLNIAYGGSLDNSAPGMPSPKAVYSHLVEAGASPNEALLLTSAAASESGLNYGVKHDGGIGYGLFGHNGDRLKAMQARAGTSKPSWQQQLDFALQELRSRPEGAAVNSAKSAEDLTAAQMAFEQPQGYQPGNPGAGHNYTGRLNTVKYFSQLGGGPTLITADGAAPPKYSATEVDGWIKRARAEAERQFPGNPVVADQAEARILQQAGRQQRVADQYEEQKFRSVQTSAMGLDPAQGGKKPETIDELLKGNPDMARSFFTMSPDHQERIQKFIEQNAKGQTWAWTPERLQRYHELLGKAETDPEGFKKELLVDEKMPAGTVKELMDKQASGKGADTSFTHAMSVLKTSGFLAQAGLDIDSDPAKFNKFSGALVQKLQEWGANNPRAKGGPSDADILKMTPDLVKNVPRPDQGVLARAGLTGPDTVQAFEVEQHPALGTKTIEQQLEGKGVPMNAVSEINQSFFNKYNRLPTADEIKALYDGSPNLKKKYQLSPNPLAPRGLLDLDGNPMRGPEGVQPDNYETSEKTKDWRASDNIEDRRPAGKQAYYPSGELAPAWYGRPQADAVIKRLEKLADDMPTDANLEQLMEVKKLQAKVAKGDNNAKRLNKNKAALDALLQKIEARLPSEEKLEDDTPEMHENDDVEGQTYQEWQKSQTDDTAEMHENDDVKGKTYKEWQKSRGKKK